VKRTTNGVELVVTAPSPFGRREIRRRAAAQQALSGRNEQGREEHTGRGTGSARYGYCPGIMVNTTYPSADIDGGARIVIGARRAEGVAELQRSTIARAARLRAHVQTAAR
jgi:hypothetical protein